jgi:hypothetical protein
MIPSLTNFANLPTPEDIAEPTLETKSLNLDSFVVV